jgi:hypothetical protein
MLAGHLPVLSSIASMLGFYLGLAGKTVMQRE